MKKASKVYTISFVISLTLILLGVITNISFEVGELFSKTLINYTKIISISLESIFLLITLLVSFNKDIKSDRSARLEKLAIFDVGITTGLGLLCAVSYLITKDVISVIYYSLIGGLFILKMIKPIRDIKSIRPNQVRILINILLIIALIVVAIVDKQPENNIEPVSKPITSFSDKEFCWKFDVPTGYVLKYQDDGSKLPDEISVLKEILLDNNVLFTLNGNEVYAIAYTITIEDSTVILSNYYRNLKEQYLGTYKDNLNLEVYREVDVLIDQQVFKGVDFVPRDELPFRLLLLTTLYKSQSINILIIYSDESKGVRLIETLLKSSFGCT